MGDKNKSKVSIILGENYDDFSSESEQKAEPKESSKDMLAEAIFSAIESKDKSKLVKALEAMMKVCYYSMESEESE